MKIETKRLILREPKPSDWEDVFEACKDLDVTRYLAVVAHPYKKKDATGFIDYCLENWSKKPQEKYPFFIELKSEKKVIGVLELSYDEQNKICGTGSWVNKNYWRKRYITEAKIAVNDFAFNDLKVRKMETSVAVKNKASNEAQKSIGYTYEGIRLKHFIVKSTGKIHDEHLYGLFKKDWKKAKVKLIKKLKDLEKRLLE